jgi:short-subunit dehydrogenase
MKNSTKNKKTIGITGASGTLGKELTKLFRQKGYKVIGFTHRNNNYEKNSESPNKWIKWECGKESSLKKHLENIDILILNHGIYNLSRENSNYENSIEINALSNFKFLNLFEDIASTNKSFNKKEIWINTSEAEILPALNPSYEISKSLIGKLVSFKKNLMDEDTKKKLILKKIILGPFKSELNPIGIMSPKFVSKKIYDLANSKRFLIIISPNPLTYLLFPLIEFYNFLYCQLIFNYKSK